MNVSRQIVLESGHAVRAMEIASHDGFWKRVELLPAKERILIELALRAGLSRRQIASMLGKSPGAITRSLQRLSRRLYDPLVLALLHPDCLLEPIERQIGVEHFLCGLGAGQLADRHRMSRDSVRRILHALGVWHRGAPNHVGSRRPLPSKPWKFDADGLCEPTRPDIVQRVA